MRHICSFNNVRVDGAVMDIIHTIMDPCYSYDYKEFDFDDNDIRGVALDIRKIIDNFISDEEKHDRNYYVFVYEFVWRLLCDEGCYSERHRQRFPKHEYFINKAIQFASVARRACLVGGIIS